MKHRQAIQASLNFALAAGLLAISGAALAAEPIDTDGPDFVDSSEVVPERHFQYELDMNAAARSGNSRQAALTSAPLLLKYGFARDWELRADAEGFQVQSGNRGWGNTAFGVKWHSLDRDPERNIPAISWIAELKLPTGSAYFRSTGALPSLRSVITWELPRDYALGFMPGIAAQWDILGRRYTSGSFGAVLNRKLDDRTRMFIELSMPTISAADRNGTIASGDIGGAYLITSDTQLGFRSGVGLNRNSPRRYLLLELAQRF